MINLLGVLILAVSAAAQEAAVSSAPASGQAPTEIVVKGEGNKLSDTKPPLRLEVDPFETIRQDLAPDQDLLLAVSPLTVSWRRTHPDFLMNDRAIEPWRATFSDRVGYAFLVRAQLEESLGQKLEDRQARKWGWSLTIADQDGRPFQHFEGPGSPPVELVWNGQNIHNEWPEAGRPYSPVYRFTGPDGSQRTRVGAPVLLKGVVHQEDSGLHLTLDTVTLFGPSKNSSDLQQPGGTDLMRSAADLIKRRYSGLPIAVRVFANTKPLGDSQAAIVQKFLLRELMLAPRYVTTESERVAFSEQRIDVVLLNR